MDNEWKNMQLFLYMSPISSLNNFSGKEKCVERKWYDKSKNYRLCNILSSRDSSGKPGASPRPFGKLKRPEGKRGLAADSPAAAQMHGKNLCTAIKNILP